MFHQHCAGGIGCPGDTVSLELAGSCQPNCWAMSVNVAAQPAHATVTVLGGSIVCDGSPYTRTVNVAINADAPPGALTFNLIANGPEGVSCSRTGLVKVIVADLNFGTLPNN